MSPVKWEKKTQKNPDTNRENIKGWLQNLIRHYERFRSSEWKTKRERERERERADSWGVASEWRCWPLVVSCHCSPNVSRWQTRRWGTLSHSTPPKQWIQPNSSVPLLIHYVVLLKWKTPAHQQTFKQQWLTRQFSNFSSTLPLLLRLLLLRLHSTISIVRKRNADAATDTTVRRVRTGQCLPRASLCLSLFL